jgi:hypothetical protein
MQNNSERLNPMEEEGILIKNDNITHVNFKTNNIEKYIGIRNLINFKFVGDLFNLNYTIKRYTALEYKEEIDGLWKLINIKISISEKTPYFYFFKNNITNEIIEVTDKLLLNNGLLFLNYNLVIIEDYKSFEWKPYITNERIPCNYQKIKLLNNLNGGYIAQKDDNTEIAIKKNIPIPTYYIGKYILIELLPKYLCANILYKNILPKKYYTDLIIGNNIFISNITNNKFISIRFYTTLDNYNIVGISHSFITDENIGKKYNFNINELFFTRYVILNENSKYILISILNYINIQVYCFSDEFECIYYILVENNPDLSSLLGKKFEFEKKNILLGSNININNNNKGLWIFLSIIDNIYNFKNVETNEISPFLINNQTTPAISNVGKIFNMDTYKIFFMEFI